MAPIFSGLFCAALLALTTRGITTACGWGPRCVHILNIAAAVLAGIAVLLHSVEWERCFKDSPQNMSNPLNAPPLHCLNLDPRRHSAYELQIWDAGGERGFGPPNLSI